ncbi:MAG TPA: 2-hydroxyacid dehydrogenase [Paludibacteraceae bacterium]|nr:2-hydroxyacid dehydrogenase [Paludibacteraceae bacterium]
MNIIVTFKTFPEQKEYLKQVLGKETQIYFKEDCTKEELEKLMAKTDILLSWNPVQEGISKYSLPMDNIRYMQLLSAGYDHVRLEDFPENLQIAANQGAYAEPMAEHVLAMLLALSKKLFVYHNDLAKGVFSQIKSQTKFMKGSVAGIVGFGAIGKATAKLLRTFGVKVMAINSSGKTNEDVDFIGTLKDLDYVLQNVDSLILSIALNAETEGLLNKEKLELMKEDAVLVNVARGAIIDEAALYEHLKTHPNFYAGIDAWWVEPFKDRKFELHYPFFELPNLLGSPHNSAMVHDALLIGTEHAVQKILKFIHGEKVPGLIGENKQLI